MRYLVFAITHQAKKPPPLFILMLIIDTVNVYLLIQVVFVLWFLINIPKLNKKDGSGQEKYCLFTENVIAD